MDSLANYNSDEEQDYDSPIVKMGRSKQDGPYDGKNTQREAEDNYDNVGMDLSEEESNNNQSPPRQERSPADNKRYSSDQRRRSNSNDREGRSGDDRSVSRDNGRRHSGERNSRQDLKSGDFENRRQKRNVQRSRSKSRERDNKYRDARTRRSRSKEQDRRGNARSRYDKNDSRDSRGDFRDNRDRSDLKDNKDRNDSRDSRDRGNDRKDRRVSPKNESKDSERYSRDKAGDSRRERRRSRSREKNRSSSRDRSYRKRSRSPDRDRRRSRSPRSDNRLKNSRYNRASSKLAAMEKLGIEIKTPDCQFVTPQMLLQKTMSDRVEEVKNATGIELPKYYNPAIMNPSRYAEQMQKRKLLWGNKTKVTETPPMPSNPCGSSTIISTAGVANIPKIWEQTKFSHDTDGKVASKFKRLMGIKETNAEQVPKELTANETLKKQEEMFHSMEAQYEVARAATHTMRGVGLGFGAFTGNFSR